MKPFSYSFKVRKQQLLKIFLIASTNRYIVVDSIVAYIICCIKKTRLFIKILNSKGLSIDPCGNPANSYLGCASAIIITTPCLQFFE